MASWAPAAEPRTDRKWILAGAGLAVLGGGIAWAAFYLWQGVAG